jgi:hypothetical protein
MAQGPQTRPDWFGVDSFSFRPGSEATILASCTTEPGSKMIRPRRGPSSEKSTHSS